MTDKRAPVQNRPSPNAGERLNAMAQTVEELMAQGHTDNDIQGVLVANGVDRAVAAEVVGVMRQRYLQRKRGLEAPAWFLFLSLLMAFGSFFVAMYFTKRLWPDYGMPPGTWPRFLVFVVKFFPGLVAMVMSMGIAHGLLAVARMCQRRAD